MQRLTKRNIKVINHDTGQQIDFPTFGKEAGEDAYNQVSNQLTSLQAQLESSIASMSEAIVTDKTLTIEDAPADAKATGDAINNLREAVGSPLVAATAAAMTDTNKVYVYTGFETGYTNGNWYYHDGTSWVSGGVYNSVAVDLDSTLTLANKAPDSKVVGDAISSLNEDITNLKDCFVEDHGEGEQVTLTNACSLDSVVSSWGTTQVSYIDKVKTFKTDGSDANPSVHNPNLDLGSGTWMLGFKYKITKADPTVGDPANIRILIGQGSAGNYFYRDVVYDEWTPFTQVHTVDLTRILFSLMGFATAPADNAVTIEIKDYFVYDVSDVSSEMRTYIQNQQSTNYQDGTVTYGEVTTTSLTPDDTLTKTGKAADSKAVGDALDVIEGDISEIGRNIGVLNHGIIDSFVQHADETVTLTSAIELKDFGTSGWGTQRIGLSNGIITFKTIDGSELHPTVYETQAKGSGKWLVGFKYKYTKIDSSIGDPREVRVCLGTNIFKSSITYNQWVSFSEVISVDLTRINLMAYGFASAPQDDDLRIEIKDLYAYEVTGVSDSLITLIQDQQDTNYQSGSVTYLIEGSYKTDQTLSESGKVADAGAVGGAINTLQAAISSIGGGVDALENGIVDSFIHQPTETAILTNADSLSHINSKYGVSLVSDADGIKTFKTTGTDVNPTVESSNINLGESTWMVGCKFKVTKNNESIGDPAYFRILLGASSSGAYRHGVEYDVWINYCEIKTVDLTRVQINLMNYSSAPQDNDVRIEIKDYFIYDVSGLGSNLLSMISQQQSTNYTDGEVSYTFNEVYEPDATLTIKGKVADAGAVGDALEPLAKGSYVGMNAVAFGTSLTSRARNGNPGYLTYLPGLTGATFDNQGIGSSYIHGNMLTAIKGYTAYNDKMLCIVEGFVNDWFYNQALGTWTDTTETTACGCLRSAINYILAQKPDITLFVILDHYGRNYSNDNRSSTAKNANNLTQYEYYEELRKVCESLGIPVIKEYSESQISENTPQFLADYVHLNDLGAKQSAHYIWHQMKHYLPNQTSLST